MDAKEEPKHVTKTKQKPQPPSHKRKMKPTLLLLSLVAIALISGTEARGLPVRPVYHGWKANNPDISYHHWTAMGTESLADRWTRRLAGGRHPWNGVGWFDEMDDEEAGGLSVEAGYEKDGKYAKIKWEKDEMDEELVDARRLQRCWGGYLCTGRDKSTVQCLLRVTKVCRPYCNGQIGSRKKYACRTECFQRKKDELRKWCREELLENPLSFRRLQRRLFGPRRLGYGGRLYICKGVVRERPCSSAGKYRNKYWRL
jgi:hypothetical protein